MYTAGTIGMDAFEVTDGAVVEGNVADNGVDGQGGVLRVTRSLFSPDAWSVGYVLFARGARIINNSAREAGGK